MAEAHPVGFQWVMEAKKRGAKIIHVDPRFSRTSAVADLHVPIRAGADIAFVGGLINYVLQNEKYFEEYVRAYTNASVIVTRGLRRHRGSRRPVLGLRSRAPDLRRDDVAVPGRRTWLPASGARGLDAARMRRREGGVARRGARIGRGGRGDLDPDTDETLQHPRCVFQILKRHFARYTPDMVAEVAGMPEDQFLEVARAITENSGRDRTTAFVYSLGWTQHTVGVQYIRTAAILQTLLGNMGRPGGGILALRGHASHPGLDGHPDPVRPAARVPADAVRATETTASTATWTPRAWTKGFWANTRDYMVSLLKAYWGDAATAENDFCYDYLPRLTGGHSTYETVLQQIQGSARGTSCSGRTRRSARPTAGCSGSGWPTWTGWWSATWS